MDHLKWMALLAPLGVIALIIFLWVYQNHQDQFRVEQARIHLEQAEFNRDFARAWNGQPIEVPDEAKMTELKQKLERAEQKLEINQTEQSEQLQGMKERLESIVLGRKLEEKTGALRD